MSKSYLDFEGLKTYHNGVISALNKKANKTDGTFYVEGTSVTNGVWLGRNDQITEYYDGLTILYKINKSGSSTTTLNINNLGAKKIYRYSNTPLSTHYKVNSVVVLTYMSNVNGGCWMIAGDKKDSIFYIGETQPTEIDIKVWLDTNENETSVASNVMMLSEEDTTESVEETLTFNESDTTENLTFNAEEEKLTFNPEDEALTFNESNSTEDLTFNA